MTHGGLACNNITTNTNYWDFKIVPHITSVSPSYNILELQNMRRFYLIFFNCALVTDDGYYKTWKMESLKKI